MKMAHHWRIYWQLADVPVPETGQKDMTTGKGLEFVKHVKINWWLGSLSAASASSQDETSCWGLGSCKCQELRYTAANAGELERKLYTDFRLRQLFPISAREVFLAIEEGYLHALLFLSSKHILLH